jgi:hypothetical protein
LFAPSFRNHARPRSGAEERGRDGPEERAWLFPGLKEGYVFMKLQYAPFLLPLWPNSPEQEALNSFIRGHRIIQARKELVSVESQQHWAILVEYLDMPLKESSEPGKSRVDYREVLSPEDFTLFSKLREVRKKLAEDNGLPVYAVCTNEQLGAIFLPNFLLKILIIIPIFFGCYNFCFLILGKCKIICIPCY